MEGRIVCKVKDEYIKAVILLVGASEGEEKIELVDKTNDRISRDLIQIPLYDAKEYIKKRVPKYG